MARIPARAVLIGFVLAAALIGSTFYRSAHFNDFVFQICMLAVVTLSWNLMASAGLISLGHAAFWGVGSYASMIAAVRLGLPLYGGVVLAIIAGAAIGALLALLTGRLKGIFFAISTLALSEGLRVTCLMLPDQTGGASGLYLPPALQLPRPAIYLFGAIAAVLAGAGAALLSRTSFSYACRAMRDNEGAAKMLGLDPLRYRVAILAISAGMVAGAGAISTWYGGYLDPDVGFSLRVTIESQIATILGGMYTLAGPMLGSVAIVFLSDATRLGLGAYQGASQLAYGLLLVLGVLFMPRGLYGSWTGLRTRSAPAASDALEPPEPGAAEEVR